MTARRTSRRTPATVALALAGVVLLSGCTASVALEPAADAVNPGCADIVVHLPTLVADQAERETNAQATGAWGSPAAVLLHCGVAVPAPTTLPCLNVNGIDWIEDDSAAPLYRYTTYGRTPASEVVIDSGVVSGSTVLVDLAAVMAVIPATAKCLGAADLTLPTDGGTLAPTATPAP
ncbi:DUF3515 family protein [Cryobacterium algoricola]|uniref:DUF3515 family protein n=1 Tax=Cryobacterium algoricola TaxID=1259183 RepID=A0ABY2IGE0_9MICO|nr:DUF3515 family protein [Cryobacterium algoricola]TFB90621.1 DUF3515 family protein [Cryobacterium algoricola]